MVLSSEWLVLLCIHLLIKRVVRTHFRQALHQNPHNRCLQIQTLQFPHFQIFISPQLILFVFAQIGWSFCIITIIPNQIQQVLHSEALETLPNMSKIAQLGLKAGLNISKNFRKMHTYGWFKDDLFEGKLIVYLHKDKAFHSEEQF